MKMFAPSLVRERERGREPPKKRKEEKGGGLDILIPEAIYRGCTKRRRQRYTISISGSTD